MVFKLNMLDLQFSIPNPANKIEDTYDRLVENIHLNKTMQVMQK